jgi:hypothetical protein
MAFLEPTSTTSFDVRARRDYWSGHQQTSEEGAVGVADHRGLNGETGLLETQPAVRQGKTMPSTPSPWRRIGPDPNRLHSAAVSSASPTSSLSRAMAPATSGGSGSCGSASIPTTVSTPRVCERPRQPGIPCSASGCPQRLVAIPASCALTGHHRRRRDTEFAQRAPRAVSHRPKVSTSFLHRPADCRLLLWKQHRIGWIIEGFGRRPHRAGSSRSL